MDMYVYVHMHICMFCSICFVLCVYAEKSFPYCAYLPSMFSYIHTYEISIVSSCIDRYKHTSRTMYVGLILPVKTQPAVTLVRLKTQRSHLHTLLLLYVICVCECMPVYVRMYASIECFMWVYFLSLFAFLAIYFGAISLVSFYSPLALIILFKNGKKKNVVLSRGTGTVNVLYVVSGSLPCFAVDLST